MSMGLAWEHLGQAMQAARRTAGLSQEEMAADLGVSRATIQKIERGEGLKKPSLTMRAYARRVGWTEESIERVLAGRDPIPATPGDSQAAAAAELDKDAARLPLRIVDELEDDGALLDSVVIPLGDGGRMVVVVKGEPGASPDEIRRNLEAWRKAQRHLQSVVGDEPSDIANEA